MNTLASALGLRAGMALTLVGLIALPAAGSAQELQAYYLGGTTAPEAFDGAQGVGLAVTLRVREWIHLQAGLDTRSHSVERPGLACVSTVTDIACEEDQLLLDSRFTALTLAAIPSWAPNEQIEIGAGAGILVSQATTDASAASGRTPKVFADPAGNVGLLGLAELRVSPGATDPVFLTAQWQGRRIRLESCPSGRGFVAPFCSTEWWTELHVGLGFHF